MRPLPPGRPEPFSGVVGALSLSASLDRGTVDANDAVTLTVRVEGEGNIRAVPEPTIAFPADFEVFPPDVSEAVTPSLSGVGGAKTFEYVLIPGVNDRAEHAEQLAEWLRPFTRSETRGHIGLLNVIPYNPRRDSPWPAPSEERVKRFVDRLADLGVFVKRRRTKGRSQMAACGQLGAPDIRKRNYVPVTTNQSVG